MVDVLPRLQMAHANLLVDGFGLSTANVRGTVIDKDIREMDDAVRALAT